MPSPELLRMQSFLANSGLDRGSRGFAGAGETMSRTSRDIADRMMEAKMLRHQLEQRAAMEQARQMQEAILSVGDSVGRGLDRRADRQFRQQQAADDAALKRELSQAEIDAANQRAAARARVEADDLQFRKQKFRDELALGREELASREKIANIRSTGRQDDPLDDPFSRESIAAAAVGRIEELAALNPEAMKSSLPLARRAAQLHPEAKDRLLLYYTEEELLGDPEEEEETGGLLGAYNYLFNPGPRKATDQEWIDFLDRAGRPVLPASPPPQRPLPLPLPLPEHFEPVEQLVPVIPDHYPGPIR